VLPWPLDTSYSHYLDGINQQNRWGEIGAMLDGMLKWIIIAVLALYILSPIDFLPDFIPIIGWIDDLFAGFVLIMMLLKKN